MTIEDTFVELITPTNLVEQNSEKLNEELNIDLAIKQEIIEPNEIISELSSVIFRDLLCTQKYCYNSRYSFPYNQKVDDCFYKKQTAYIGLRILTPNSNIVNVPEKLTAMSSMEDNVLVCMLDDSAFIDEIKEYLQLVKYLKNNPKIPKLKAKQDELVIMKDNIRIFIDVAIKNADIYVHGTKVYINTKDPVQKLNEALGKLVTYKYSKLNLMETTPALPDIETALNSQINKTFEIATNKAALKDMLFIINQQTNPISLKTLKEKFSAPPYGFIELDVQWLVAKLYKQRDISLILDNKNISPDDALTYITGQEYSENLCISVKNHPTDLQISAVKDVMKYAFSIETIPDFYEEDELIPHFKLLCQNTVTNIKDLFVEYRIEERLPGKITLETMHELCTNALEATDSIEFFQYVENKKEPFLKYSRESKVVFTFFETEQQDIFQRALKCVDTFNTSKNYVVDIKLKLLIYTINTIITKSVPYGKIYKLPDILNQYSGLYNALIEKEILPVLAEINSDQKQIMDILKGKECAIRFKDKFLKGFNEILEKIEQSNEIVVIRNMRYESEAIKEQYIAEIQEYEEKSGTKRAKNVSLRGLTRGNTVHIESEYDIDKLLLNLKAKLMREITDGDINLMM